MKHPVSCRILSLICACVLLCLFAFPVMAEAFDLTAMTDTEVLALLEKVNREIADRGLQKTAKLPGGAYIAGRDIPAGTYIYTCRATGDDWGNVTVYSEGGSGKQLFWTVVSAPDAGEEPETAFITLHEGDQLKSDVPFSLTIFGGVLFE